MVTEMSKSENCSMSNTKDRKRVLSKEYDVAPSMTTAAGTQTEHETKRPCPNALPAKPPMPSNNGWGDVYKNRENFIDMHLC
jgi:hypothetical protein